MRDRKSLQLFQERYLARVRDSLAEGSASEAQAAVLYARNLLENQYPPLFDLAHLAVVTGVEDVELQSMLASPVQHYDPFRLWKRAGGSRLIVAPRSGLKQVQRWL